MSHDMPPDQFELYAAYGIAAEAAQTLEVEAGNVALAFVALMVGIDQIDEEKKALFSSLEEDVNRRTLGNLLRQVGAIVDFDETAISIVDEALKKRNYLAHHFFRVHNFAIFSEHGRQEMFEEIKEIQEAFAMAHAYLSAIQSLVARLAGIPQPDVEQLVKGGKKVRI